MKNDRRKTARSRAKAAAIIVADDGLTRLSALILDRSHAGVQIRLQQDSVIPTDCCILFDHRIEPCRVIWQASRAAGLLFVSA